MDHSISHNIDLVIPEFPGFRKRRINNNSPSMNATKLQLLSYNMF